MSHIPSHKALLFGNSHYHGTLENHVKTRQKLLATSSVPIMVPDTRGEPLLCSGGEERHTIQLENVKTEYKLKQWILCWKRAHISVESLVKNWERDKEGKRHTKWRITA